MKRTTKKRYAMCIENEGYAASLEKRKVYEVYSPEPNDPEFMIRVADESGEDYLFPAKWFVPLELPAKARRALAAV
ncbi:MAG TPA: hypothetical protein VHX86_02445 [Tepidisphaeraceae bacterium]|jgi:hypothetical protein|nr:hypothetical protein [Tepidisphaeraceae bacterium]